jgi:hypothetical protein
MGRRSVERATQQGEMCLKGLIMFYILNPSRDSSVGIGWATGWMTGVRFSAETRDWSLLHSVQTSSGANLAFCQMSMVTFPGDAATGE